MLSRLLKIKVKRERLDPEYYDWINFTNYNFAILFVTFLRIGIVYFVGIKFGRLLSETFSAWRIYIVVITFILVGYTLMEITIVVRKQLRAKESLRMRQDHRVIERQRERELVREKSEMNVSPEVKEDIIKLIKDIAS